MNIPLAVAVLAVLISAIGFVIYWLQMWKGGSVPNIATWLLWVFLMSLTASSYFKMSGNLAKSILAPEVFLGCLITLIIAFVIGRFSGLDKFGIIALLLGVFGVFVWWKTNSAFYAHLISLVCNFIAVLPTFRLLWKDPTKEKPLPWAIWVLSYVLMIVVVLMLWENKWEELAYPALSIFMLSTITILCWNYSREKIDKFFASRRI